MRLRNAGFFWALCATVSGLLYIATLSLSLAGLLPKPRDTFWQLLPSLFLAWSYMAMMGCHYKAAPPERNIHALIGRFRCEEPHHQYGDTESTSPDLSLP